MYRATTRNIEVEVEPKFESDRSSSTMSHYFWAYTIAITNHGEEKVQLMTRHWIITDAHGRRQEVHGDGVVGEQPEIGPGECFEYTSGVPLTTPSGFMAGTYRVVSESGEVFDISIPGFSLDVPGPGRTLN